MSTPTIVTRAQWGARPPRSRTTTTWGQRIGVAVHHSASPTNQTVRTIQDYHMDTNGWSDIGYNWLVTQDGRLWEGRGWLVIGAHAAGQNTGWVGVCWIGNSSTVAPTDAALRTLRWVYDEASRLAGRTLQYSGHGQLPGQATECPGSRLRAWIANGMPVTPISPPPDERSWFEMATEEDLRRVVQEELAGPLVFGRVNPASGRTYAELVRGLWPIRSLVTNQVITAREMLQDVHEKVTRIRDGMRATATLGQAEGAIHQPVLTRTDEHVPAPSGALESRLAAAAQERAELTALVRQAQSGQLTAEAVCDALARRLLTARRGNEEALEGRATGMSEA